MTSLEERPTAAICFGNCRAYGLVQGLQAAGWRIPEDISVVGFFDRQAAEVASPSLTSLIVAGRRAGQMAATAVFALMEGQPAITPGVASEWIEGRSIALLSTKPER